MHLDPATGSLGGIRQDMGRIRSTPQSDHMGMLEEEKCVGSLA